MKNKNLIIYQTNTGKLEFKGNIAEQTIYATQKQIAEVFDVSIPTTNEHLSNVYSTGELDEGSTIRKFRIVKLEGKRHVEREEQNYNLDAISK